MQIDMSLLILVSLIVNMAVAGIIINPDTTRVMGVKSICSGNVQPVCLGRVSGEAHMDIEQQAASFSIYAKIAILLCVLRVAIGVDPDNLLISKTPRIGSVGKIFEHP